MYMIIRHEHNTWPFEKYVENWGKFMCSKLERTNLLINICFLHEWDVKSEI